LIFDQELFIALLASDHVPKNSFYRHCDPRFLTTVRTSELPSLNGDGNAYGTGFLFHDDYRAGVRSMDVRLSPPQFSEKFYACRPTAINSSDIFWLGVLGANWRRSEGRAFAA